MTKRVNPDTSISAFKSLQPGEVRDTYEGILNALYIIKEGHFEDIAKQMKCSPGKVWRRLGELDRKYNLIHRPGNKKPLKSGRNGYTWKINSEFENQIVVERLLPGNTVSDHAKAIKKLSTPIQAKERYF